MNDHRFIELVNLYIDRQVTAADTAELEAEIQGNPRRRAVYKQYCQMHRATTLVCESFRAQAAAQPAGQPAVRATITPLQTERRWRRFSGLYLASGLAAAACLSLVFVRLNTGPKSTINLAGHPAPAGNTPLVAVQPKLETPKAVAQSRREPLSLRSTVVSEQEFAVMQASLRQGEQQAFTKGQIKSGSLPSLFEDGVFDGAPLVLPVTNQRTFPSPQSSGEAAEFTAFQFQR